MLDASAITRLPESDPTSILRYRDGLYAVDLLTTAVCHLDFFTRLADQPATLDEICEYFKITRRPADVMLTLFAANGFVKCVDGVFHLDRSGTEHLVAGSPWFMGPYYDSLKDRPVAQDFLKVLRTGKPATWGSYEEEKDDWHDAMLTTDFAQMFTAAMNCRGLFLGKKLSDTLDLTAHQQVLDVGGGSGIYACSLVANQPHLKATVLEQSPVDDIARKNIGDWGLSDTVSVLTGDMFQDAFPQQHDVHLFSNVMHDWDVPEIRKLLKQSFEAMPIGGRLLIHETFLNEPKTGPLPVAEYSCILMHSTQGRCYSTREMIDLANQAGFSGGEYHETGGDRGVISAFKTP